MGGRTSASQLRRSVKSGWSPASGSVGEDVSGSRGARWWSMVAKFCRSGVLPSKKVQVRLDENK